MADEEPTITVEPEPKPIVWEDLVKEPFTRINSTTIDCTLVHPKLGEIPFTASSEDPEEHGRNIFAYLDGVVPK